MAVLLNKSDLLSPEQVGYTSGQRCMHGWRPGMAPAAGRASGKGACGPCNEQNSTVLTLDKG
jgi:hypothetical protein